VSSGDIFRGDTSLSTAHSLYKKEDDVNLQLIEKAWAARPAVLIVDKDTCEEKQDGETGEVWVTGDSVTQGYYNNPVETDRMKRVFFFSIV